MLDSFRETENHVLEEGDLRRDTREVVEVDAHGGPAARVDRRFFGPHGVLRVFGERREVAERLAVPRPLVSHLIWDMVIRGENPIHLGEALVTFLAEFLKSF